MSLNSILASSLRWSYTATSVAEADALLARLWASSEARRFLVSDSPSAAATPEPIAVRTGVMNLAVVASGEERAAHAASILATLPRNPSRTLFMVPRDPEGPATFAARLDSLSRLSVKEGEDGERVLPGHAYIAPGGLHLSVERSGANYIARVRDGDVIAGRTYRFHCVFTPGHTSNHMCYALEEEQALFTGDHVMQGSTVVISPPDGDMHDYFASLQKLDAMDIRAFAPGHGTLIETPREETAKLVAHRLKREQKVIDALVKAKTATIDELVPVVYDDVSPKLHVPARRSLHGHLLKLEKDGKAVVSGETWRMV